MKSNDIRRLRAIAKLMEEYQLTYVSLDGMELSRDTHSMGSLKRLSGDVWGVNANDIGGIEPPLRTPQKAQNSTEEAETLALTDDFEGDHDEDDILFWSAT